MAADHPLWFTSWPDGFGAYLYKDETNLWVGTSKGLLQSSLKTNLFKTNTALTNVVSNYSSLVSYDYGIYDNKNYGWHVWAPAFLVLIRFATRSTLFGKSTPEAYRKKVVSTAVFLPEK